MTARCSLGSAGVAGALAALALAWPPGAGAAGRAATRTNAPAPVVRCLTRHRVGAGVLPEFVRFLPEPLRKLLPPGVTAVVHVTQTFGPEADGVTFRMFHVATLYFFRTASLARRGEARIGFLRALNRPPTVAEAAPYLHRVVGTVVVIWNYPRRHRAVPDHVVACLAAAGA